MVPCFLSPTSSTSFSSLEEPRRFFCVWASLLVVGENDARNFKTVVSYLYSQLLFFFLHLNTKDVLCSIPRRVHAGGFVDFENLFSWTCFAPKTPNDGLWHFLFNRLELSTINSYTDIARN